MSKRKPLTDAIDAVVHVEKTSPAHAKGMRELVGISLNVRQGEPVTAMRVDFELNAGAASLPVNGADFLISLRTCYVTLSLSNCEISPQTKYEARLTSGSIEATMTETRERSSDREIGGGIGATLNADAKSGVLAKLGLSGGVSGKKKTSDSARETLKRQPQIDLIVTGGQDRWQVGDPEHGDARRQGGRLLGSYFGEERDQDGDPKPLCIVAALDPASTSKLVVSAVVRIGQLHMHVDGEPATADQREDVDAELRERSRQVAAQHRKQEGDLRARVAGLVLAKAMHAAQRSTDNQAASGEVLLVRQALVTAPRRALKVAD